MKKSVLCLLLAFSIWGIATLPAPAAALQAQSAEANAQLEGIWEGYDGEWHHVSRNLIALAEAIPADKYGWRPAPGVRSVSEVLMHIALSNFYLLSVTGPKMPPDIQTSFDKSINLEKTVTAKPEVIQYLKRSLDAVRRAHAGLKPADLERKVNIYSKTVPVDGMYLRIIAHANEHYGQLIAYARENGVVPPWSETPAAKK
jgi:uncharacterized damage-inducible protein DinB